MEELRQYMAAYKPKYWLFEGQDGGRYSNRSVQQVVRRAIAKAGANPYATTHTLRHSFATHLFESGMDIRRIKDLLAASASENDSNHFVSGINSLDRPPAPSKSL